MVIDERLKLFEDYIEKKEINLIKNAYIYVDFYWSFCFIIYIISNQIQSQKIELQK